MTDCICPPASSSPGAPAQGPRAVAAQTPAASFGGKLVRLLTALLAVSLRAPAAADAAAGSVDTFTVATATFAANLQEIDVAVGADGNIVFIWEEFGDKLGSGNRIVTRAFSRNGIALEPATRIDISGNGLDPAISADGRGAYVASWQWMKPGGGHALYTRRLDAWGRGIGSEVRIDPADSGPVVISAVAGLPSGAAHFWKQNGLWVQLVDNLVRPVGASIKVADNIPGFHGDIEATPGGGFVVAWADTWRADYSWARVYDAAGNARGPAIAVDSSGLADRVAVSDSGRFAVVGGGVGEVWMRLFAADGTALGPRQVLRTVADSVSTQADAAFDSRGNLFVAWREYDTEAGSMLPPRARIYDSSGSATGPDFELSSQAATELRTATTRDDCFVSAWYNSGRVYANVFCPCSASSDCGNGVLDPRCEACDDGNNASGDGCDADCSASRCGNGIVAGAEICDDGNAVDGDGCDSNCTPTGCGNAIVTGTELCDDGNDIRGDGCEPDCRNSGCGSGVLDDGEACDDGNAVDGDGCDSNCTPTGCGNAVVTGTELCDDGNTDDGDGCDSNCTPSGCGNAVVGPDEECDDGNRSDGDGCDRNCLFEDCGNGRPEGSEACDDGNREDGDGCNGDCTFPVSHDAVVYPLRPVDIAIPVGSESASRNLSIAVGNADVAGDGKSQVLRVRLAGSDGDCPPGTLSGAPDFERGSDGVQGSVELRGGESKTALAEVSVSRMTFAPFDKRVPQRCTLRFSVAAIVDGNEDPTPDNNEIAVEINVVDTADPAHSGQDEFFIESMNPATIKIPQGQPSVIKQLKPVVRRSRSYDEANPIDVTVSAGDGDCPAGTIGIADFDRRAKGTQNRFSLKRGRRAKGRLALIVRSEAFDSPSDAAPRRCTALLTASGLDDSDISNNTTRLPIDVIDRNDY